MNRTVRYPLLWLWLAGALVLVAAGIAVPPLLAPSAGPAVAGAPARIPGNAGAMIKALAEAAIAGVPAPQLACAEDADATLFPGNPGTRPLTFPSCTPDFLPPPFDGEEVGFAGNGHFTEYTVKWLSHPIPPHGRSHEPWLDGLRHGVQCTVVNGAIRLGSVEGYQPAACQTDFYQLKPASAGVAIRFKIATGPWRWLHIERLDLPVEPRAYANIMWVY